MRILPSTGPTMLCDIFPVLYEEKRRLSIRTRSKAAALRSTFRTAANINPESQKDAVFLHLGNMVCRKTAGDG
ncbi:hypothetical protein [Mesorhizobium sp.]|uniref:hypothetical protein n=1 Tax=Mesorhizobium sp. TaxID=1871066 RepID=UPI00257B9653|nr:hypothetical protein [Mesorhizobium sp.]